MLKETKELALLIESGLLDKIEIAAFSMNSMIPYMVVHLRETLLHRIAALATSAVELFEQKREIPAMLLTRGVMETFALMFELHGMIKTFLSNYNEMDFGTSLNQLIKGDRLPDDIQAKNNAKNILTLIEHVDKEFPGFKQGYDFLSEYAHPNWLGVSAAYGKINHDSFELLLGRKEEHDFTGGITELNNSLIGCHHFYNDMAEMIYTINDYFEGNEGGRHNP